MASVGETKALLAAAALKCGESWGALDTAKEHAAGALAACQEAQGLAGQAFDGSSHPNAGFAVSSTVSAGLDIHVLLARLDTAQDHLLAAQNACELYMGMA